MKILLEESDLLEIVTNHVKSTNLLNLANKEFNVELEIDGTEVTASIQTSASSLTPSEPKPKKKVTRRKSTKAQEKQEEPAEKADAANDEVETKEPEVEEPKTSTEEETETASSEETQETPEEDEEVVEDKPPFFKNVKPSEPVVETDDKPRKSLFK